MQEIGVVTAVLKNEARVQIKRHAACGDCGACQVGKEKMTMETVAQNPAGAKIGERVLVEMETVNVLRATTIMYGFPLLAFLIGCGLGMLLAGVFQTDSVLTPFFSGILLTAVAYGIIRLCEKKGRFSGSYQPVITQIISDEQTDLSK